LTVGSVYENC